MDVVPDKAAGSVEHDGNDVLFLQPALRRKVPR